MTQELENLLPDRKKDSALAVGVLVEQNRFNVVAVMESAFFMGSAQFQLIQECVSNRLRLSNPSVTLLYVCKSKWMEAARYSLQSLFLETKRKLKAESAWRHQADLPIKQELLVEDSYSRGHTIKKYCQKGVDLLMVSNRDPHLAQYLARADTHCPILICRLSQLNSAPFYRHIALAQVPEKDRDMLRWVQQTCQTCMPTLLTIAFVSTNASHHKEDKAFLASYRGEFFRKAHKANSMLIANPSVLAGFSRMQSYCKV